MMIATGVLLGCGKKAPEPQADVPNAKPPAQPPVKEPGLPSAKPKVELTEATLTPGMEAALKGR